MIMNKEDLALDEMIREISTAPEIYKPSAFWEKLGDVNKEQLQRRGYGDFKRTVNQNYYNWLTVEWNCPQFKNVRRLWWKHKSLRPLFLQFKNSRNTELSSGIHPLSTWKGRLNYKLFVGLLWEYARWKDPEKLLDKLEEPFLGNSLDIRRGNQQISQDLANSVLERNVIMQHVDCADKKTMTVAELGAGYGRLAYVFLKTTSCRYFIFDIPPALGLSQWYLSKLFPERRIFRFRHFQDFSEIREELAQCDIAFFTPNQLEMFPDDYVDIFATVSSLHEMRMDQIKNYITLMERISQTFLFIKQWNDMRNEENNITVRREDYILSEEWNILEDHLGSVQDLFFTLLAKKQKRGLADVLQ